MNSKIKVIIVDDEPLSREGLMRYVSQIDFLELIETFDSALKVIPFLATTKIDLILLDIQMPYLTGYFGFFVGMAHRLASAPNGPAEHVHGVAPRFLEAGAALPR